MHLGSIGIRLRFAAFAISIADFRLRRNAIAFVIVLLSHQRVRTGREDGTVLYLVTSNFRWISWKCSESIRGSSHEPTVSNDADDVVSS